MPRYEFYQDAKQTVWIRTHFTIEASNGEVAMLKAAAFVEGDLSTTEGNDDAVCIEQSETLYDTMEDITVEENGGQATLEVFFSNGDDLADNVSGPIWDYRWEQADIRTKERITGLRQVDFDTKEGYDAFAAACDRWWNEHSDAEKIAIWKKYDR